ncbi:spermine/spermidine synthase family domain protein [Neisseria meningitidis 69155]|nr:spermine/spermidine synthase family domain protein [Neisseria meningitidis 69155]
MIHFIYSSAYLKIENMNSTASKTLKGLSLVFFASGFCALIY